MKNNVNQPETDERTISIVLPVHNREDIIGKVIEGIIENTTNNAREMFVILDACTDDSENVMLKHLVGKRDTLDVKIVYADYDNQTIACNIGCRSSQCKYSLIVPSDMIIDEPKFDQRLLNSFEKNAPNAREGNTLVLVENSKLVKLDFEVDD